MENKLSPALITKVKEAESAEEILALAKENKVELSGEEAKAYFEQFHKTGEMLDEELGNVSGGGCYYKDGRLVTTYLNGCDFWTDGENVYQPGTGYVGCRDCDYCVSVNGLLLCNNPINNKK